MMLQIVRLMDYITSFDIRLGKDIYYGGEMINGSVVLENTENIKIKGIRVLLRGKAHAQLKVTKSGERRTVKDDQYILDEKLLVWGKDKCEECESIPILPRGMHQFPFQFALPQSSLPCSLESKLGTIRYYIKVIIDIPYASSPQGIKYFTIIGPHIDCMEEKYLVGAMPRLPWDRVSDHFLCSKLKLKITLDRTAYVCGENIRIRAHVENRQDVSVYINTRLTQHVEYFIEKGVLGESKALSCPVLEHKSPSIAPNSQGKYDSALEQPIRLPVVPPTLIGVCRLIQIYYILKVCLEDEKGKDSLPMEFPLTVATLPYRVPNAAPPMVDYDFCSEHVEGGRYISPEFRLGQVYDGQATGENGEFAMEDDVILYRPVYVRIADRDRVSQRYSKDIISLRRGGATKSGSDVTLTTTHEPNGKSVPNTTMDSSVEAVHELYSKTMQNEAEEPLLNVKI
uniref:Arrestin C-terminal-like domain-containing protein n=1 Tax=Ascaris lumbricoides TaxID=6252 RepID=A0A9J2PBR9_ASCLU